MRWPSLYIRYNESRYISPVYIGIYIAYIYRDIYRQDISLPIYRTISSLARIIYFSIYRTVVVVQESNTSTRLPCMSRYFKSPSATTTCSYCLRSVFLFSFLFVPFFKFQIRVYFFHAIHDAECLRASHCVQQRNTSPRLSS